MFSSFLRHQQKNRIKNLHFNLRMKLLKCWGGTIVRGGKERGGRTKNIPLFLPPFQQSSVPQKNPTKKNSFLYKSSRSFPVFFCFFFFFFFVFLKIWTKKKPRSNTGKFSFHITFCGKQEAICDHRIYPPIFIIPIFLFFFSPHPPLHCAKTDKTTTKTKNKNEKMTKEAEVGSR